MIGNQGPLKFRVLLGRVLLYNMMGCLTICVTDWLRVCGSFLPPAFLRSNALVSECLFVEFAPQFLALSTNFLIGFPVTSFKTAPPQGMPLKP